MLDFRELSIQEEYEDLVFRKVMAIYVQKEGKQILSEIKGESDSAVDPQKIEKLYNRQERKENWHTILKFAKKAMSIAAMIVFVTVVSLSSVVVASADVRKALADAIYHLAYEDYDRYTEIKLGETTGFVDGEQFDWEGAYAPTYVPEGFVLDKLSKYETRIVAEYLRDSEYIVFSQAYQSITQIDSENAEINEMIQIGDSDGLLVVKNGMTDILWSRGDTVFHLYGMGETNEMVKMAESIKLVK